MQEQVEEKTVALSIQTGKLTGRVLARAMSAALRRIRNPRAKHGKQSVKSLARQGDLRSVEITEKNIKSFERTARKYGVDFALRKDISQPNRWLVFFKAKDADTLTAAFSEFSAKALGKQAEKRPSLLEQLSRFREQAKGQPDRVRQQDRGVHER